MKTVVLIISLTIQFVSALEAAQVVDSETNQTFDIFNIGVLMASRLGKEILQ